MINPEERTQIINLIKREVVPAIGCTEPMAVSLCVAKATETLGSTPARIEAFLSANILKNAMGVGIPGTHMVGLPIAVALGALVGKSEYGLEVLRDVTDEDVARGKQYVDEKRISIHLKEGIEEKLYIEVVATDEGGHNATAIIAHDHTHFIKIEKDGEVLLNNPLKETNSTEHPDDCELSLQKVFEFATTSPLVELEFIKEARRLNENASREALKGNYGHALGKTLSRPLGRGIMGDSIFSHILSATSSACDARMAGAPIPVMSNSGSGNQGISCTMPVVVYAEENHNTDEELTRALILSHLTAIYIKQSLGKLSALCGCVVASTGSACGLTYLMGGGYEQVAYSVKNMIANLACMVCDGAKPACALKVTSGVSTAVLSAMLAIQNRHATNAEGLIEDDVDRCIHNLTRVGGAGMTETDTIVLESMTHKGDEYSA
ncbi:MAG: L-serine ammonia-lyase, iron-sulfur-dependent, subunit alpha [Muribaculaceae bacterium]|nr:L-serine ammonia-lyase, iron-sulfur-dependent, subunit alpha [Muribaculaceae bacterium]